MEDSPKISKREPSRPFLAVAFVLLSLFSLYQVSEVVSIRSPEAQVENLVPVIGGVAVDRPLSDALLDLQLEPPPGETRPIQLRDYQGKTVFLNFWATWCKPCLEEIPSMLALARRFHGSDFVMLAVSYDETWEPVQEFFKTNMGGIPKELVLARDPGKEPDLMRLALGAEKIPETFVVQNGVVRHKFISNHDWSDTKKMRYFRLLLEGNRP